MKVAYATALGAVFMFCGMTLAGRFVVHLSWRSAIIFGLGTAVIWVLVTWLLTALAKSSQPPEPRW